MRRRHHEAACVRDAPASGGTDEGAASGGASARARAHLAPSRVGGLACDACAHGGLQLHGRLERRELQLGAERRARGDGLLPPPPLHALGLRAAPRYLGQSSTAPAAHDPLHQQRRSRLGHVRVHLPARGRLSPPAHDIRHAAAHAEAAEGGLQRGGGAAVAHRLQPRVHLRAHGGRLRRLRRRLRRDREPTHFHLPASKQPACAALQHARRRLLPLALVALATRADARLALGRLLALVELLLELARGKRARVLDARAQRAHARLDARGRAVGLRTLKVRLDVLELGALPQHGLGLGRRLRPRRLDGRALV